MLNLGLYTCCSSVANFVYGSHIECSLHIFSNFSCWSYVGYDKDRINKISLGRGCWSKATALHEIAHSLGFHHEQSRPDRDDYVKIRWENIYSSK